MLRQRMPIAFPDNKDANSKRLAAAASAKELLLNLEADLESILTSA